MPRSLDALIAAAAQTYPDLPTLADTVCAAVQAHIPYVFACLATTDPATGVITWAHKSHPLEVGDEEFAAAEYGGPDINLFTDLVRRPSPVGALVVDTQGHPESCRRHREFLHPRFGFTDELRLVAVSRGAMWGALAVYRDDAASFTPTEVEQLATISGPLAEAIQSSLFRVSAAAPRSGFAGPVVLIVTAENEVSQSTPAAEGAIAELGGWDHGSLPATVLALVASTRAQGVATDSRAQVAPGRWLSLRAAPLTGPPGKADVVVTIEPTPQAALSRLALSAHGLTAREEDVALLVLRGVDTKGIAASLHLSPHTVQDHLKSVFAKLGVTSRREMTARLVLDY